MMCERDHRKLFTSGAGVVLAALLPFGCEGLKADEYVVPEDEGGAGQGGSVSSGGSKSASGGSSGNRSGGAGGVTGGSAGSSPGGAAGEGGDSDAGTPGGGAGGAPDDALPPAGFDYYVDAATGSDEAPGSREMPFRTISRAVDEASALLAPARVYVAEGHYDAALGENFPIVLRRGVALHGASAERVTVRGSGAFTITDGSNAGTYFVTLVAGDAARPITISGVSLAGRSAAPAPQYVGVMCDRGDAPGGFDATTLLENVDIMPGYHNAIMAVSSETPTASACNLVMRGVNVSGASWGVVARGCAWNETEGTPVSLRIGDARAGNTFSWMRTTNGDGAGILIQHCVDNSSIRNNVFSDNATGIWIHPYDAPDTERRFEIAENTLVRHSSSAVFLRGNSPVVELDDNHIEDTSQAHFGLPHSGPPGYVTGLFIDGRDGKLPVVRARRNEIVRNDSGMWIVGPAGDVTFDTLGPLDFGTPGDPGENVFSCNGRTRIDTSAPGGDVEIDMTWVGWIPFAGNGWDHSPPSAGSYQDGTDLIVWRGNEQTVDRSGSTVAAGACP